MNCITLNKLSYLNNTVIYLNYNLFLPVKDCIGPKSIANTYVVFSNTTVLMFVKRTFTLPKLKFAPNVAYVEFTIVRFNVKSGTYKLNIGT